ncbi:hypothetical protein Nepgr_004009 [Nepenthes gracilis]|uniref:Secreted protein n=1 Tax=Nepenthes gracilis TaxID=150966 RepID=A0AAD3S0J1_NEPGR|nr:hypothetical protein Nepgr_004009 [Nepenthes gracilis]
MQQFKLDTGQLLMVLVLLSIECRMALRVCVVVMERFSCGDVFVTSLDGSSSLDKDAAGVGIWCMRFEVGDDLDNASAVMGISLADSHGQSACQFFGLPIVAVYPPGCKVFICLAARVRSARLRRCDSLELIWQSLVASLESFVKFFVAWIRWISFASRAVLPLVMMHLLAMYEGVTTLDAPCFEGSGCVGRVVLMHSD